MAICFSCGEELKFDKVFRTTICAGCGKGVRVCRNCGFYTPGAHWDCRETISELVRDKDMVNFCEYFTLRRGSGKAATDKNTGGARSDKGDDSSRAAFNSLFDE
jgi:hypothetical protein